MYSTCIGLILKGYNVFENSQNSLRGEKLEVTEKEEVVEETVLVQNGQDVIVHVKKRKKSLKGFMDSIKDGLIDLFKEEEDAKLM